MGNTSNTLKLENDDLKGKVASKEEELKESKNINQQLKEEITELCATKSTLISDNNELKKIQKSIETELDETMRQRVMKS